MRYTLSTLSFIKSDIGKMQNLFDYCSLHFIMLLIHCITHLHFHPKIEKMLGLRICQILAQIATKMQGLPLVNLSNFSPFLTNEQVLCIYEILTKMQGLPLVN